MSSVVYNFLTSELWQQIGAYTVSDMFSHPNIVVQCLELYLI